MKSISSRARNSRASHAGHRGSEGLQAIGSLAGIGHERDCLFESGEASSNNGQAAVVIVVAKKSRLSAPHGIEVAGLQPLFTDGINVEVGVWNEVAGILPVISIKNFRNSMRWPAALQSLQACVEDGVANDQMAILVVFVPTAAPMGDHDLWLLLPDYIADSQRAFLIERKLGIWISQEQCPGSKQMRGLLGGRTLHIAVLLDRSILRCSPLAEREAQQHARSAALDLLCQRR